MNAGKIAVFFILGINAGKITAIAPREMFFYRCDFLFGKIAISE